VCVIESLGYALENEDLGLVRRIADTWKLCQ